MGISTPHPGGEGGAVGVPAHPGGEGGAVGVSTHPGGRGSGRVHPGPGPVRGNAPQQAPPWGGGKQVRAQAFGRPPAHSWRVVVSEQDTGESPPTRSKRAPGQGSKA